MDASIERNSAMSGCLQNTWVWVLMLQARPALGVQPGSRPRADLHRRVSDADAVIDDRPIVVVRGELTSLDDADGGDLPGDLRGEESDGLGLDPPR